MAATSRSDLSPVERPTAFVLGIDPGRHGAAVLLDRRARVVALIAWRPSTRRGIRGYRIGLVEEGNRWTPDPAGLAEEVVRLSRRVGGHRAAVYVEDSFVGRNPRTAMLIARWSGCLVGGLLGTSRGWVEGIEWVGADQWRSVALGLGTAIKRAEAKRLTREAVGERFSSIGSLSSSTVSEHVADAIGVALYGIEHQHQQARGSRDAESSE